LCDPPAPSEISTLSLHDALPILGWPGGAVLHGGQDGPGGLVGEIRLQFGRDLGRLGGALLCVDLALDARDQGLLARFGDAVRAEDRKSTRLNSSHVKISYAVFCL